MTEKSHCSNLHMKSFIYIGRLSYCQSITLNQAFFGRFIRRINLCKESKVTFGDKQIFKIPKFCVYRIESFRVIGEIIYVDKAALIKEVNFS